MGNQDKHNHEKTLQDCNEPSPLQNSKNIDPVPEECADDFFPSQRRIAENPAMDWQLPKRKSKLGPPELGDHALCDPIQTGQLLNDLDNPNRDTIYRYSRALRGANEAMLNMFSNTVVLDEEGKAHAVPIMWASQERAVAALIQENVRKDPSIVVSRIKLPIMSIWANGHAFDQTRYTYQQAQSFLFWLDPLGEGRGFTTREQFDRDTTFGVTRGLPVNINYTLFVWTQYQEDMDQIIEQVMLKFSPVAYIRVRGVYWEIIVNLDSVANNLDIEPGENRRVLKYQFEMTAKSYIPQPITRYKTQPADPFAGLGLTEEEIQSLIAEFEQE